MNIVSGIITFILTAACGIVLFFFLMLALNGFSERDAMPAMIFYFIWAVGAAIVLSAGSFFSDKILDRKIV